MKTHNAAIGYGNATDVAQETLSSGRAVAEIVLEKRLLSAEALADILRPDVLTAPRSMVRLQN